MPNCFQKVYAQQLLLYEVCSLCTITCKLNKMQRIKLPALAWVYLKNFHGRF